MTPIISQDGNDCKTTVRNEVVSGWDGFDGKMGDRGVVRNKLAKW